MKIFPKEAFEKIELDKIREITCSFCVGDLGKKEIEEEVISTDASFIREQLSYALEAKNILVAGKAYPLTVYFDVREICELLRIDNIVLDVVQLNEIYKNILSAELFKKFFKDEENSEFYPTHTVLSKSLCDLNSIAKAIDRILDKYGNIKDSASPRLRVIRSEMIKKKSELDRVFGKTMRRYKKEGFLSDSPESMKYGRRVLSLPAHNKRKIEGIIHAESSTGKTIFMEPKEVSLLNNVISELRIDEKNEVYKILKELTAQIAPFREDLVFDLDLLIAVDVYYAKGRLGHTMDAVMPKIVDKPEFKLKKAFHPYLLLKNIESRQKTIDFNLFLDRDNRILVLSGPNAGGKTVILKAVGLLQTMTQCSYLIPASAESELGIFKKLFIELGDQQSIENELSTYSSRLHSMNEILRNADTSSLVLIDEFGSGTDPRIGGAIAESMMENMLRIKSIGLITTHYDNLKKFAFNNSGIINGSMLFDIENIKPTYHLKLGKPGSSYGLEIAQRIGLPGKVIKRAKVLVGKNYIKVEDLLNTIEKEKLQSENLKEELADKNKKLDRLIKQYDNLFRDFEVKRKRLKLESKQLEAQKINAEKYAIDKFLKEIKDKEIKKEDLIDMSIEYKDKAKNTKVALTDVAQEYKQELAKGGGVEVELKIGDHVKLKTAETRGEIIDFKKKGVAIIQAGIFRIDVSIDDLIRLNNPIEVNTKKSITIDKKSSSFDFNPHLDIRGFKIADAGPLMEEFIDKAYLANSTRLKVLHGIGSGALQKLVWKIARSHNVSEIVFDDEKFGGERVSFITL